MTTWEVEQGAKSTRTEAEARAARIAENKKRQEWRERNEDRGHEDRQRAAREGREI